ncbi:Predicted dithiol-disulfide isomerase, DsbA family [Raineyella antarctica]|uniref:Predicted dithiol-disulfide isomerase, DsbA family n=1 Tax=Raineyella antarctica TaxID=1577474 RepID=A0A1G6HWH8_9ACTN|nr:DsbA family oxidoreductase [Raineyella antarctica]SDB98667.1 Predicted dithiol-disulfide isomerase, DsbA family [Raineyella antarctica]
MTLRVDIWSDIACPWCFIGKRRFEAALAGFAHRDDVRVTWRSYQLDPSLPERYEGSEQEYLASVKGMSSEQVGQMLGTVSEQARTVGLEYDWDRLVPANSLRAHLLLHLAAGTGGVDVGAVKDDLLSAHFLRGEAISDPEVLVAVGGRHGLSEEAVRTAMEDDRLHAEVLGDFNTARSIGVTGVPFFVLEDKYAISGAQPTELFAQALQKVWEEAHPAPRNFITLDSDGDAPACGPEGCD